MKRTILILFAVFFANTAFSITIDEALFGVAESLYESGDYEQAAEQFKNLIVKYPDSEHYLDSIYYAADCFAQEENFTLSQYYYAVYYRKAETETETARALYGLAQSYIGLEQWEEAAEYAESFLDDYPTSPLSDVVYYYSAVANENLGEEDSALLSYNKIVFDYPASDYYDEAVTKSFELDTAEVAVLETSESEESELGDVALWTPYVAETQTPTTTIAQTQPTTPVQTYPAPQQSTQPVYYYYYSPYPTYAQEITPENNFGFNSYQPEQNSPSLNHQPQVPTEMEEPRIPELTQNEERPNLAESTNGELAEMIEESAQVTDFIDVQETEVSELLEDADLLELSEESISEIEETSIEEADEETEVILDNIFSMISQTVQQTNFVFVTNQVETEVEVEREVIVTNTVILTNTLMDTNFAFLTNLSMLTQEMNLTNMAFLTQAGLMLDSNTLLIEAQSNENVEAQEEIDRLRSILEMKARLLELKELALEEKDDIVRQTNQ